MVDYLSPRDFDLKYPLQKILNNGSYGNVYSSSAQFAIKEFKTQDSFCELIKELNVYCSYSHPCILKPLNWTLKNNVAYLAMDQGVDIVDAYISKEISIEEIVADTSSAISFLNSQGIAHCDIKPDNIIFHNGKAKIIDMGIAKYCVLGPDKQYYIPPVRAYTSPYIDPEYYSHQYNSIKSEMAALALTYIAIIENHKPIFGELYRYIPKNNAIKWFFDEAKQLQADRSSLQATLQYGSPVRKYQGTIFFESPLNSERKCDVTVGNTLNWAVQLCYNLNLNVRTLFLILHLIHRVFAFFESEKEVIVPACISLCACVLGDRYISSKDWSLDVFKGEPDFINRHTSVMIKILKITQGIITTTTYWDYATSKDDLLTLLDDTIKCAYDPEKLSVSNEGSDKCIRVKDIINLKQLLKYKTPKSLTELTFVTENTFRANIKPCFFEFKSAQVIEKEWTGKVLFDNQMISVVLHNRDKLSQVRQDIALTIYRTLIKEQKEIDIFVLDLVSPNWRDNLLEAGDNNFFPF